MADFSGLNYWQRKNFSSKLRPSPPGELAGTSPHDPEPRRKDEHSEAEPIEKKPKTRKQQLSEIIDWPSREELTKSLVSQYPTTVARQLGVTVTDLKSYCSKFKIRIPDESSHFKVSTLSRRPSDTGKLVDPRSVTEQPGPRPVTTGRYEDVFELIYYCKAGDLYRAESYIDEGYPLQFLAGPEFRWTNRGSPLSVALQNGNLSMVQLLLSNGYDSNGPEPNWHWKVLDYRRMDIVHLLLDFGYDWKNLYTSDILDTYDTILIERIRLLGWDPCEDNCLAKTLGNCIIRPIAKLIKDWRASGIAGVQGQLDVALVDSIRARDEDRARSLLNLGANGSWQPSESEDSEEWQQSPASATIWYGDLRLFKSLKINLKLFDPAELLYDAAAANNIDVYTYLNEQYRISSLSSEQKSHVLQGLISGLKWIHDRDYRLTQSEMAIAEIEVLVRLRELVDNSLKWVETPSHDIASLRRCLLGCRPKVAATLVSMLQEGNCMRPELFKKLFSVNLRRLVYSVEPYHPDELRPYLNEQAKKKRGRPKKDCLRAVGRALDPYHTVVSGTYSWARLKREVDPVRIRNTDTQ